MESSSSSSTSKGKWVPWVIVGGAVVVGLAVGAAIITAVDSGSSASARVCNANKVANKALPSVVTISARSGATGGIGSGEVIQSDGYILTNNHVISPAANGGTIEVTFSDGKTAPATLTGRDPKADLAVIKVNESNLPVIPFGNSSDLVVGQPVVALGAPLGLSNTVTSGIVSALDRTVEVPSDNGQTALLVSAIQTDAAINPGNSGGTLADCSGDLVGVPSAGATAPSSEPGGAGSTGSIGLGFAIPSNIAQQISNEIIKTGSVTHSYWGIQVITLPPTAAEQAGLSGGVYVSAVVPGGPSAQAGLQQGDIITSINGTAVTSTDQLEATTISEPPGTQVTVEYQRSGSSHTTKVTLGQQP